MKKTTYFVNFEDVALLGKGNVTVEGYEGWYEMNQVSGFDILEDFYNRAANIFNQQFHHPNKPAEVKMTTNHSNTINALLKANLTNDTIKKITLHRMRDDGENLSANKAITLEDAQIIRVGKNPETQLTEIFVSGFAQEEVVDFMTQPSAKTNALHFEYDASR